MVAKSCLILYGNSVFLAGIKAQLENTAALELITMQDAPIDVADGVRACQPRALLFDLAMGYPDFAVALLHEQPGLLLIGVDPNSNELLVLSSQQKRAVAVADLLKVIQRGRMTWGRGDTETREAGEPTEGFIFEEDERK